MLTPKTATVEVLSDASNHWVIRTPGRRFPALVVQGDSFHILVSDLESLASELEAALGPGSPLAEEARSIAGSVRERLDDYEAVVKESGLELPYPPASRHGS